MHVRDDERNFFQKWALFERNGFFKKKFLTMELVSFFELTLMYVKKRVGTFYI